jgi:hypothetical protein
MPIDNVANEQVASAVASAGVPGLRVVASATDVARMERDPACKVRFTDAVRLAVEAFLGDRRGSGQAGRDAPLDLVIETPEAHGLPPRPTDAQAGEVLRGYLRRDAGAALVLLTPVTLREPQYQFTPEYGEAVDRHWVFRIMLPDSFDLMTWAVVDITGQAPSYAYTIE